MRTLGDRLDALAELREVLDETEDYYAERVNDVDRDEAALDGLRSAIETVKARLEAWNRDVGDILERRARTARELAKPLVEPECQRCDADATPRSVGNIEDVLAMV